MCESIGHWPLRNRCPKSKDGRTNGSTDGETSISYTVSESLAIEQMDRSTDHPTELQITDITPFSKATSSTQTSLLKDQHSLQYKAAAFVHPSRSVSFSIVRPSNTFFLSRVVIMRESPLLSFAFVTHASDTFFFYVALDSALGGLCVNQKWTNNCLDLTNKI